MALELRDEDVLKGKAMARTSRARLWTTMLFAGGVACLCFSLACLALPRFSSVLMVGGHVLLMAWALAVLLVGGVTRAEMVQGLVGGAALLVLGMMATRTVPHDLGVPEYLVGYIVGAALAPMICVPFVVWYRRHQDPGVDKPLTSGQAQACRATHRTKTVGVLYTASGILALLWAGAVTAALLDGIDRSRQPGLQGAPHLLDRLIRDHESVVPVAIGAAVLSVAVGLLEVAAGVAILRRWKPARTLGIIAGLVCCIGFWGWCLWPMTLAFGVYGLVVLVGRRHEDSGDRPQYP